MKICINCDCVITSKNAKFFCCRSCSSTYHNKNRNSTKTNKFCYFCGDSLRGKKGNKFCNRECHINHKFKTWEDEYLSGKHYGYSSHYTKYKRFLVKKYGYRCNCCGIIDWNGKPIVLELEHIDGNHTNNSPDNIELICPNCHSQTTTYKGKNVGNGRHSRKQRYKEGKSY